MEFITNLVINTIFLFQLEIQSLQKLGLPKTPLMLENASFLMQGDNLMAWPLVCDPSSRVIDWVKDYLKDKDLVTVRYSVSTCSNNQTLSLFLSLSLCVCVCVKNPWMRSKHVHVYSCPHTYSVISYLIMQYYIISFNSIIKPQLVFLLLYPPPQVIYI